LPAPESVASVDPAKIPFDVPPGASQYRNWRKWCENDYEFDQLKMGPGMLLVSHQ
jgi:hypothetical protein